jgi:hypothetical protein
MRNQEIPSIGITQPHETLQKEVQDKNFVPINENYAQVALENKDFMTVNMLVRDPSCPFSEKALRFHIWRSGVNGLAPAIFRIGRKILIKRAEWIKWIESHAQQKKRGL